MRNMRAELATGLAALVGWALLTWTIGELVSWWAYPISTGLLLLSLVGWKLMAVVAWEGLYSLSRDDDEKEQS